MRTEVIRVDTKHPARVALEAAVEVLRRGGLVVFPTETVYGLGADAGNDYAVRRIYDVKGRPPTNPLIVHVASISQARRLAKRWTDLAQGLAETFWPGSLTLVVEKRDGVSDVVTAGGSTVAIRIPSHPVALALLRAADLPIAAPSANKSNRVSPTSAEHVLRQLDGLVELILDAGPCPGGLESTVVDVTGDAPRILRPGLITPAQIEELTGKVQMGPEEIVASGSNRPLQSPGQMPRHYAPQVPLEIVPGNATQRIDELLAKGLRVGWMTHRPARWHHPKLTLIAMPEEPRGYAARLYAALHELESQPVDIIVVDSPPQEGDIWLAVHDRLRRASAAPDQGDDNNRAASTAK